MGSFQQQQNNGSFSQQYEDIIQLSNDRTQLIWGNKFFKILFLKTRESLGRIQQNHIYFRKTNDGGVVNDQQIRDFTNARFTEGLSQCHVMDGEKDCSGQKVNMYSKETVRNFTLVTYNPALGDGLNGVQILQQIVPMRTSKIMVILLILSNTVY